MTFKPTPALLESVDKLACQAGQVVQRYYGKATTDTKSDGSPVTDADHAAEEIILNGLAKLTPDIPIVAEEAAAAGNIPDVTDGVFWLVDPLDGTKEFIRRDGRGEFTVNIALIFEGQPILGVVVAPALGVTYGGLCGSEAYCRHDNGQNVAIEVRNVPAKGLTIVSSRSHGKSSELATLLRSVNIVDQQLIGSSLKLCLVAAGKADLYPRLGPTMEWDIAAGQAVLAAAGGRIETFDGRPMTYAKKNFLNPNFVAYGRCKSIDCDPARHANPSEMATNR